MKITAKCCLSNFEGSYTFSVKLACFFCIDKSFYRNRKTLVEGRLKIMEAKQALTLPKGLEVTNIEMIDTTLTLTAISTQI